MSERGRGSESLSVQLGEEEAPSGPEVLSHEELQERIKHDNVADVTAGGGPAVWTVSTAKHGNGVRHLLHYNDLTTYWQSDGVLPHVVTVQFQQLTPVERVAVYLDYTSDESYTPRLIKVRAGTYDAGMTEVAVAEVNTPVGWVVVEVGEDPEAAAPSASPREATAAAAARRLHADHAAQLSSAANLRRWCTKLEVLFLENHQNGRDCHVRGLLVLGPSTVSQYTSTAFTQHQSLR